MDTRYQSAGLISTAQGCADARVPREATRLIPNASWGGSLVRAKGTSPRM